MPYFEYSDKEVEYLKKKDKKLGAAIEQIGYIQRETKPDTFFAIINSIISQQISSRAADTVVERLEKTLGQITPKNIASADDTVIQKCGMSMRKVGYIKGITEAVLTGGLDLEELRTLADDEIIKQLVALPGIGVWTAEMLLLFSFCRPDIVSYGDLAIRRGMMNLYGLKELPKENFYATVNVIHPMDRWHLYIFGSYQ